MKPQFMKLILATIAAMMFAPLLSAQRSFDVVSVKPNVSGNSPSDPRISPGRFFWANVTLRQLIQTAYDKRPYQLIGMQEWGETARFDVIETASPSTSPQHRNI